MQDPDITAKKKEAKETTDAFRLGYLAGDNSPLVRRYVAANPATPPVLLNFLAGDKNFNVRYNVASNTSAFEDTLADLAGDSIMYVIVRVAKNTSTSEQTLQRIANNFTSWAPEVVRKTLVKKHKLKKQIKIKSYCFNCLAGI